MRAFQLTGGVLALVLGSTSAIAQTADPAAGTVQTAPSDPKQVFVQNCGGCHTLGDAGTSGTVGPNLDQLKPSMDAAVKQITNGGGGMPAFGDQLSEEQIQALADYVVKSTGG